MTLAANYSIKDSDGAVLASGSTRTVAVIDLAELPDGAATIQVGLGSHTVIDPRTGRKMQFRGGPR